MGFGVLAGARVRLRAVRGEDQAAIEAWYDEAATAGYEEMTFEDLCGSSGNLFVLARPDADEPIGLVAYEMTDRRLTIPFIALAKAYRGWGYGSQAVRLLEDWAIREGIAKRFRAEIDVRNGLGLYFWLRLGYRPAGWRAAGRRDSMAMVRDG